MANDNSFHTRINSNYFNLVKDVLFEGKEISDVPSLIEKKLADFSMGYGSVDNGVNVVTPHLLVTGHNPYLDKPQQSFEAALVRYDSKFGRKIIEDELSSVDSDFYNKLRENADFLLSHHAQSRVNRMLEEGIDFHQVKDVWNHVLYEQAGFSKDYDAFLNGLNAKLASSFFGAPSVNVVEESERFLKSEDHLVIGGMVFSDNSHKSDQTYNLLNELHAKTNYFGTLGYSGFDFERKANVIDMSENVYGVGVLQLTPNLDLTARPIKRTNPLVPVDYDGDFVTLTR